MFENPLKVWRGKQKLSQQELAIELGVKAMTVSRWERGGHMPRKKYWPKIEETTGIVPSQLIGFVQAEEVTSS